MEPTQSAYRASHSMETAVSKDQNYIFQAIDSGHCVFVQLDLSAAVDTVAHHILLERMKTKFDVVEDAHEWLRITSERSYPVSFGVSLQLISSPRYLWCAPRLNARPRPLL